MLSAQAVPGNVEFGRTANLGSDLCWKKEPKTCGIEVENFQRPRHYPKLFGSFFSQNNCSLPTYGSVTMTGAAWVKPPAEKAETKNSYTDPGTSPVYFATLSFCRKLDSVP